MTNETSALTDSSSQVDDPLLELRNVEAAYGQTVALQGISMAVGEGEVVAVVGRNGAGKTTTLQSILGNVTVIGGRINLAGEDVTDLPPDRTVAKGVAIVPENRRIFRELTVEENLRLSALGGSDGSFRFDIETVFEMFENLGQNRDSLGSNLSGGEQQMLAIGRALVSGADLMMLDEPTEGLAPLIIERVEDLIAELNEEGLTIFLVEQNVEMAMKVADRVYIMDRGQIAWSGTTPELRADEAIRDRYLGVKL